MTRSRDGGSRPCLLTQVSLMLDAGLPLSSRRLLSLDAGLPNASFRLNKEIIDEVCVTQVSLTSLTKSPSRVTRSPSRVTKSPFPAPHEGDLRHKLGRMLLLQHRETCGEGDLVRLVRETCVTPTSSIISLLRRKEALGRPASSDRRRRDDRGRPASSLRETCVNRQGRLPRPECACALFRSS